MNTKIKEFIELLEKQNTNIFTMEDNDDLLVNKTSSLIIPDGYTLDGSKVYFGEDFICNLNEVELTDNYSVASNTFYIPEDTYNSIHIPTEAIKVETEFSKELDDKKEELVTKINNSISNLTSDEDKDRFTSGLESLNKEYKFLKDKKISLPEDLSEYKFQESLIKGYEGLLTNINLVKNETVVSEPKTEEKEATPVEPTDSKKDYYDEFFKKRDELDTFSNIIKLPKKDSNNYYAIYESYTDRFYSEEYTKEEFESILEEYLKFDEEVSNKLKQYKEVKEIREKLFERYFENANEKYTDRFNEMNNKIHSTDSVVDLAAAVQEFALFVSQIEQEKALEENENVVVTYSASEVKEENKIEEKKEEPKEATSPVKDIEPVQNEVIVQNSPIIEPALTQPDSNLLNRTSTSIVVNNNPYEDNFWKNQNLPKGPKPEGIFKRIGNAIVYGCYCIKKFFKGNKVTNTVEVSNTPKLIDTNTQVNENNNQPELITKDTFNKELVDKLGAVENNIRAIDSIVYDETNKTVDFMFYNEQYMDLGRRFKFAYDSIANNEEISLDELNKLYDDSKELLEKIAEYADLNRQPVPEVITTRPEVVVTPVEETKTTTQIIDRDSVQTNFDQIDVKEVESKIEKLKIKLANKKFYLAGLIMNGASEEVINEAKVKIDKIEGKISGYNLKIDAYNKMCLKLYEQYLEEEKAKEERRIEAERQEKIDFWTNAPEEGLSYLQSYSDKDIKDFYELAQTNKISGDMVKMFRKETPNLKMDLSKMTKKELIEYSKTLRAYKDNEEMKVIIPQKMRKQEIIDTIQGVIEENNNRRLSL